MAEWINVNKERNEKLAELLEELPISRDGKTLLQRVMENSSNASSEAKATAAAIAYRQLVEMGEPILFSEVCKLTGAEVKEAKREYRKLYYRGKELSVATKQRLLERRQKLLERYAQKYGDKIIDTYKQFKEVLDRHSPEVAVAVCIYLSGDYLGPLTEKEVADELNVEEHSIGRVLRELKIRPSDKDRYCHLQSKRVRDIFR